MDQMKFIDSYIKNLKPDTNWYEKTETSKAVNTESPEDRSPTVTLRILEDKKGRKKDNRVSWGAKTGL